MSSPSYPPISSRNRGLIRVVVESFGYLHGPPSAADITIDLRDVARDPHTSPELRELTGLEPVVRDRVLAHSSARGVLVGTYWLVRTFLPVKDAAGGRVVGVAFGCSGGRHRSVVLANELVNMFVMVGVGADVSHRDILRPVVNR